MNSIDPSSRLDVDSLITTTPATGADRHGLPNRALLARRLIGDRRVHQRLELPAEVERAGGQQLGHEDRGQVLGRIHPEDRGRRTAPHVLAGRSDDLRGGWRLGNGYGEAETHALEPHLA